jgi:hypothetical protein
MGVRCGPVLTFKGNGGGAEGGIDGNDGIGGNDGGAVIEVASDIGGGIGAGLGATSGPAMGVGTGTESDEGGGMIAVSGVSVRGRAVFGREGAPTTTDTRAGGLI